jgi:hypothetical protein
VRAKAASTVSCPHRHEQPTEAGQGTVLNKRYSPGACGLVQGLSVIGVGLQHGFLV